jgi:beta-barrel assembly-enhancing protease
MRAAACGVRFWACVVVVALVMAVCGCKGGQRLLSQSDEIQLGREAGDDFEREHGRDHDARRTQLMSRIGSRIEPVCEPPDYPYDFRVMADDAVNAVAFPGGRIYLYRGLFEALAYDEAQLAWVAGHEATHVARRHATRRIEKQLGYELVIQLVFGKDSTGKIAGLAAGLVLQDYGRDNEFEADRLGVDYAQAAGYDPTAAVAVLDKFAELHGKDPNKFEILFMSHPGNTDRRDAVKAHIKAQGWSGRYYRP